MRPNRLLETLRAGGTVVGLFQTYPAPGIIEGMCRGWDFVWVDGQHGEFSYDSILHAVQAASATGVESLIRTPGHEPGMLGLYADLGPAAVMVPMVENRTQAEAIVSALRFPPLGNRSYGGRRVVDLDGREYYRERELMVLAQIETPESVENAADIIGTEGIDALFFGPDDMKCRMGLPIDTPLVESEQLMEALRETGRAATAAGRICGGIATSSELARVYLDAGCRLLVSGADIVFLREGAARALTMIRGAIGGNPAPQPTGDTPEPIE